MPKRYESPAVRRAMAILQLLADTAGKGATLAEVARELRLPRSSTHTLLHTLEGGGFLVREEQSGRYRIGFQLFEIGNAYLDHKTLARDFDVVSRQVVDACTETCQLGVLDGRYITHLARRECVQDLRYTSHPGKRFLAHGAALGKAILAWLPEAEFGAIYGEDDALPQATPRSIASVAALRRHLAQVRALGYATDDEETMTGLQCIAAPIRDSAGRVIAAISVAGPVNRMRASPEHWERLVDAILCAAADMSRRQGYSGR